MPSRKRSAEVELHRALAELFEAQHDHQDHAPVQAGDEMQTPCGVLSRIWAWATGWAITHHIRVDVDRGLTQAETDVQTAETSRPDNQITAKRRRISQPTIEEQPSSKDIIDSSRDHKSGRGVMPDLTGLTEEEKRMAIDQFYQPRTPPALRKRRSGRLTKITQHCHGSLELEAQGDDLRRSSSISASLTETKVHTLGNFLLPPKRKPPIKTSQSPAVAPAATIRHTEKSIDGTTLDSLLDGLLLHDNDTGLPLSSAQKQKRYLELERREREKAAEIKRREAEKRELEAEAKRAARLHRRLPEKRLVQPLNAKWEIVVGEAERNRDRSRVFTTSIGGTSLAGKDFATLLGRTAWLNDEIINAYIEWVVDAAIKHSEAEAGARGESPSKVPRYIAHSSFFYENLTKKGPISTDRLMKRKGAPGKALLEVNTVFVPICRGNHWTVGVVRPVARTIEYFDSFGGSNTEFIERMRGWLKHQLGPEYHTDEWTEPSTGCATQTNGYDCGVFVCTNAFCVGFDLQTSSYVENDMEQQRKNIAAVLINRGFVGDFAWDNLGL